MVQSEELKTTFIDLQIISRKQLHSYTKINAKVILKLLIKYILKRKNLLTNDKYFWPNGLLAISLEWSHRTDGSKENLSSLKKHYKKWIKKGIPLKNA